MTRILLDRVPLLPSITKPTQLMCEQPIFSISKAVIKILKSGFFKQ